MCIMKIDKSRTTINNYYSTDPRIEEKLNLIIQNQQKMATELETLTKEVAETKTVMQSAKVLIDGFKARLDAAIGDKAKLLELSADLDTEANSLAASVAANTVAEEEQPAEGETQP